MATSRILTPLRDLNPHLRQPNELAELRKRLEILERGQSEPLRFVGATGQPAFGSGWTNHDGGTPGTNKRHVAFWKDALGIVHLQGYATAGTTGTTIFTLPEGYRPGASDRSAVVIGIGGSLLWALAESNGQVKVYNHVGSRGTGYANLDTLHFRAGG